MPKKTENQRLLKLWTRYDMINEEKSLREIQKINNEDRLLNKRLMKEKEEYQKNKRFSVCCKNINYYMFKTTVTNFLLLDKIKLLNKANKLSIKLNNDIIKIIASFHDKLYFQYYRIPFYLYFDININLLKSIYKKNLIFKVPYNFDDDYYDFYNDYYDHPLTDSDSSDDFDDYDDYLPYYEHKTENSKRNSKSFNVQQKYLQKLKLKSKK